MRLLRQAVVVVSVPLTVSHQSIHGERLRRCRWRMERPEQIGCPCAGDRELSSAKSFTPPHASVEMNGVIEVSKRFGKSFLIRGAPCCNPMHVTCADVRVPLVCSTKDSSMCGATTRTVNTSMTIQYSAARIHSTVRTVSAVWNSI